MNAPEHLNRTVDGVVYDVGAAMLIADDAAEGQPRATFLYRTRDARYFTVDISMWAGERERVTPLSEAEARAVYDGPLTTHHLSAGDAFGDMPNLSQI